LPFWLQPPHFTPHMDALALNATEVVLLFRTGLRLS
jgi:hypothetical protein